MSSEALGNVKQHVSGMRDMRLPALVGIVMDMGTGMALGQRVYSTCVEHSDSELFGTNTHTWSAVSMLLGTRLQPPHLYNFVLSLFKLY